MFFSAMFMEGPHGREFLNSAMKERVRLAAHPGAHPGTGEGQGRGNNPPPGAGRMSPPPIRTVEKEWRDRVCWNELLNLYKINFIPGWPHAGHETDHGWTGSTTSPA